MTSKLPGFLLAAAFLFGEVAAVAWMITRYESLPWWQQVGLAGWMWTP